MKKFTRESIKESLNLPIYYNQYEIFRQMTPWHWHDHLEIIYLLEGSMHIKYSDFEYSMSGDEFYVINSNKIHEVQTDGTVKVLLIQIPYMYMKSYIVEYDHIRFEECYSDRKHEKEYRKMKSLLDDFLNIQNQQEKGYEILLMAKVQEFLYLLYSRYSYQAEKDEKETNQIARIKELFQYVSDSYSEPISLSEAAKMVALNKEYFCRIFKRCMGVTFLEYVNLVRIDHIHEQLLLTDDSVTDILERNGFTNYKVFSRMFKEQFGMTPSEMRKQMGKKKVNLDKEVSLN